MKSKFKLYNKNIVLTGASGGLGREMAGLLVKKYNCRVIGIGRNEEKLKALADELQEKFTYHIMDVGKKSDWNDLADMLSRVDFQTDVVINNAGILPRFTRFGKYSENELHDCMATNFGSVLYSTQLFSDVYKSIQKPTAIINISSSDALCPLAGTSLYSASKAAVKALSEAMREEYRGRIYIPTVCPGFIRTDIMRGQNNNDNSIIDMVSMPADKAACKILKKINKGKSKIVIGFDAHFMSAAYRIAPVMSQRFFNFILKASGLNLFSEIYN